MGIVSFIVDAANNGLNEVAESQFAAVASGMGGAIMVASTLAVILLFINMSLQMRPMDGAELFPLLIKIALIVNERSKLTRLQHLILTRLWSDKAPRRAALI